VNGWFGIVFVVDKYSENEEKVEYVIFQRGLQVSAGVFMVPSIRN
jgi:hypothetical protein